VKKLTPILVILFAQTAYSQETALKPKDRIVPILVKSKQPDLQSCPFLDDVSTIVGIHHIILSYLDVWEEIQKLTAGGYLNSIKFSPDSKNLALSQEIGEIGYKATQISVGKLSNNQFDQFKIPEKAFKKLGNMAFSPNNAYLVAAGRYGLLDKERRTDTNTTIQLYQIRDGECTFLQKLDGPKNGNQLKFSPDGKYLTAADVDMTYTSLFDAARFIQFWQIKNNQLKLKKTLTGECHEFSPDSKCMAIISHEKIEIWDIQNDSLTPIKTSLAKEESVCSAQFSPDGQFLLCHLRNQIHNNHHIDTYKIYKKTENDFELVQSIQERNSGGITLSPNGTFFAYTASDGTNGTDMKIWKLTNNQFKLYQVIQKVHLFCHPKFSPCNRFLAFTKNKTLQIWQNSHNQFSSTQTIQDANSPDTTVMLSPNGKFLASILKNFTNRNSSDNTLLRIWQNQASELIMASQQKPVNPEQLVKPDAEQETGCLDKNACVIL